MRPSGIYPWNVKIKHMQINTCHFNRCEKSPKNLVYTTPFHDKILNLLGVERTYLNTIRAIKDKPTSIIVLK